MPVLDSQVPITGADIIIGPFVAAGLVVPSGLELGGLKQLDLRRRVLLVRDVIMLVIGGLRRGNCNGSKSTMSKSKSKQREKLKLHIRDGWCS